MSETFLRLPAVIERTGLSRSTIYDRIQKGLFPKPIKLGERAVAWTDVQIQEWIEKMTKHNNYYEK